MDKVREEAALWFARMNGAAPDHPDRLRFEAWLAASPDHAAAYEIFTDLYADLGSPEQTALLAQAARDGGHHHSRRLLLKGSTGAGLALAVLGGAYFRYETRTTWRLSRQTGIGEIATLALNDGSTVILGPESGLDIKFSRNGRHATLAHGQAIFEVARNAGRPFTVQAGPARVTVLGTRFAVNILPDCIRTSVDHGRVKVESGPFWRRHAVLLTDGQVAEVLSDGGKIQAPQQVNLTAAAAFTFEHRIITFDQAGLPEIAETLSRYRSQPVRVAPAAADYSARISATIQMADIEHFIRLLPRIAPVAVVDEGGIVTIQPL